MKTRRIVLIILGYIFVLFELISFIQVISQRKDSNTALTDSQGAERIAFYIGYNFWIILALICFVSAYRLKKKIKRRSMKAVVESIGSESKSTSL